MVNCLFGLVENILLKRCLQIRFAIFYTVRIHNARLLHDERPLSIEDKTPVFLRSEERRGGKECCR